MPTGKKEPLKQAQSAEQLGSVPPEQQTNLPIKGRVLDIETQPAPPIPQKHEEQFIPKEAHEQLAPPKPEQLQSVEQKQDRATTNRAMDMLRRSLRRNVQQQDDTQGAVPPQQAVLQKTQTRQDVEAILARGITEIYQTMTPKEQEAFRKKGESTAQEIETVVSSFKATAKKVVELVRAWLAFIPRVNKYFLEQESKLKTDEILKLQRKMKQKERINNLHIE